jgi:hypothetical protein
MEKRETIQETLEKCLDILGKKPTNIGNAYLSGKLPV